MSEVPGVNPCFWWIGQIVDGKNWQKNSLTTLHNSFDVKGEAYSYKVRIIGRHDPGKIIPDSQLPIASVMLPVTAGSGHAGSVQTPNLKQGCYVCGFYADGEDGNQPIISGILPINPKEILEKGDPDYGLVPRSGFFGLTGQTLISTSDISLTSVTFSPAETIDPNIAKLSQRDQFIDRKRTFYLPKTKACEGSAGPLKGIQKHIGELIAISNLLKSGAMGSLSDLQGFLTNQLNNVKNAITTLTKTLFDTIRSYVMNRINSGFSMLLSTFEPHIRIQYSENFEKLSDTIFCLFQKAIKNLPSILTSVFQDIIDRYINAPICAAEVLFSSVLSSLFNTLTTGIESVISSLGIPFIANNIFSAFSVVTNILQFLSCDEKLNCEMPEQWSIMKGTVSFLDEIGDDITDKLEGLTSELQESGEAPVACNTSQVPCGPPTINFISSSGSGAIGNPIVSITGSILGIDILNGGTGYTTPPRIEIDDNCGNGSGASAIAIMRKNEDGSDSDVVDNIVMVDPGIGYLQYPNGSTGGNGYVFSTNNDTIIYSNKVYSVYECNTTINVFEGDLIFMRESSTTEVYNNEGVPVQTILGKGQITPIVIQQTGVLTTPECIAQDFDKGSLPSSDNQYPVVLEIGDVALINKGYGYTEGDNINISPSNGAELSVTFDSNGSVDNILVLNSGSGFTDFPVISIDSKTGFNVVIIPVFKVKRIGDLTEGEDVIPSNTDVINVIDCVGVVSK